MHNLKIIITSTRPGRKGDKIGAWLYEVAKNHPEFNTEILDLAEINLPIFNEPNHPRLQNYIYEHTKEWSKKIAEADAFIFITPEYNYGFTAAFKNAIDYLHHEWKFKPAGIASYAYVSGGTRAAQMMKEVLTAVSIVPVNEAVSIPFFIQFFDQEGNFKPNQELTTASENMLNSLVKWSINLKGMRS